MRIKKGRLVQIFRVLKNVIEICTECVDFLPAP